MQFFIKNKNLTINFDFSTIYVKILARSFKLGIEKLIKKLKIKNWIPYGWNMAKIEPLDKPKGKLILVTSINPTKYGEGKTTMSIGLADSMTKLGKKTILALREPSLGPVFGVKGGATGGGKSKLVPSDEINLHFTGDFHAITSANNLLCALIDNHLFHGNQLDIDKNNILFHRCIDMNDRSLREITISQEKLKNNVERKESFTITSASEIMAILCLAKNLEDLKERLGDILIAFSRSGKPIYARDLKAENAMTILLKNAIMPNLVMSANSTPAIVHGGPFANIAHGCNSIIATKTALSLGQYCVTEAGFGADLGGEKFIDLKCRLSGLNPNVVVIVVSLRAIKSHSDDGSLDDGLDNLLKHIENFKNVFNKQVVVAINKFENDDEKELAIIQEFCAKHGVKAILSSPYLEDFGCIDLAKQVISLCDNNNSDLKYAYDLDGTIKDKISSLAKNIYGAGNIVYSPVAEEKIAKFEKLGGNYPIVVAKTQYSLSDDEKLTGRPKNFDFHVRDIEIKTGAKFIVVIAGKISLMPGLPLEPNSEKMTIDKNGDVKL